MASKITWKEVSHQNGGGVGWNEIHLGMFLLVTARRTAPGAFDNVP